MNSSAENETATIIFDVWRPDPAFAVERNWRRIGGSDAAPLMAKFFARIQDDRALMICGRVVRASDEPGYVAEIVSSGWPFEAGKFVSFEGAVERLVRAFSKPGDPPMCPLDFPKGEAEDFTYLVRGTSSPR